MKLLELILATACLGAALAAHAADAAPATGTPAAKAASSPAVKAATPPGGAAPVAGGSGGGAATNGSNTGTQVKPKLPKCPDPANTACPAVKAPVKAGG
ncbi:hypothetical protein ASC95_12135 [Pelomonas sp. Root1217]|uniref:histone n=1 Tax=Pelomonas sp. Root1217 TaxID=1736430 RepID=UPI0007163B93|nr:histone [Pelomonas sp. Root1217]KQV53475.1 hypothetical protein ASC95_12135 [Pelomonas sp. Root1217]